MSQQSSSSSGVGFTGLLTVLFIGLKLGHVIDWAWVWVLSPLWISALIVVAILLIVLVVALIAAALE
jgi:hypothetical protein